MIACEPGGEDAETEEEERAPAAEAGPAEEGPQPVVETRPEHPSSA